MKLRCYLVALVVGSVLPVVLFAGVMTYLSYRQQREYLASGITERARAISAALDREFLISIQSLKVLAASTHLDKGQLAEFHTDMQGALAAYSRAWQNLTLVDLSGQQLLNVRRSFGSPLPRTGNPEAIERVQRSMKPAIANLTPGPVTGALGIVVHVPVLKDGHVKYFLNAIFYPAPLTNLLLQQNLPLGWVVTILDGNDSIVARSRDIEKFFGKRRPAPLAAQAMQVKEASWLETTIDGFAVAAALYRSDFTGWTVEVAIPLALLEAPMKRSMTILTAGGTLLFLIGIGLAFLFGSRISRPIAALSAAAAALGKGEIPRLDASPIIEVNEAARAIEDAAANRDRAEKDALKSYERFMNIAQATNDAVWDWDLATNYVWWNEGVGALFGYSMDELEPDIAWRYQNIHPEDRDKVVHGIQALFDSGEQFWSEEYRYLRADGSYAYVFDRGYVTRDDRGAPARMVGAMLDVTERKRAEHLLRDYNAELEQKVAERTRRLETINKELESFSYSVSHDLRAPLRSIDGFSQALLEDYADKLGEEGKDYLQRVRASTQRMGELIDDMLNLSRVTRGEMRREPVDLTGMAQALAAELQQSAPDREVEFIIADGLTAQGDARLLRIVLGNLLGNAWKYTSKHPRARIEFGFAQNNGQSAYFVRDDGAGFDMAYADKLFGVFQRLHRQTEFSGTGVGLATVQRIMHRHGGQVWADAQVDKGATFYFTVERAQHER